MRSYTVVLCPNGGCPYWSVSCPAMPGALSQGISRDDALKDIVKAIELWLEVEHEEGRQPLVETPEPIAREVAFVLGWKAEEGWPLLVETAQVAIQEPIAA